MSSQQCCSYHRKLNLIKIAVYLIVISHWEKKPRSFFTHLFFCASFRKHYEINFTPDASIDVLSLGQWGLKVALPYVFQPAVLFCSVSRRPGSIRLRELVKIQPLRCSGLLSLQETYWCTVILVNKSFWAEAILILETDCMWKMRKGWDHAF